MSRIRDEYLGGSPEQPPQLSPRIAALRAMVHGGWANASFGSEISPIGYYARMSNLEEDLVEIDSAFEEEFTAAGLDDHSAILGHFLYVENDEAISVSTYPDEASLVSDFDAIERRMRAEGES